MKYLGDKTPINEQYKRAKYILSVVIDADNKSGEALVLRQAWDVYSLGRLLEFVKDCEEAGVSYITN